MKTKNQLKDRLLRNAALVKKNKVLRVCSDPLRMFYPEYLRLVQDARCVDVETFWGANINLVLPEAVSTFIYRCGFYEEDTCFYMLDILEKDMVFVDIGAHFGFFTLLGRQMVGDSGKVLAIEPTKTTFEQIQKNVSNFSNVTLYNMLAHSKEAELNFRDYGLLRSAFNTVFSQRKAQEQEPVYTENKIRARKVDDLLIESAVGKVDLIKIDTESSEMEVLNGLACTLREHRPKLIIEMGDFDVSGAATSAEIVEWLEGLNYSAYEYSQGKILKHSKKTRYNYSNLLFVPNGRPF